MPTTPNEPPEEAPAPSTQIQVRKARTGNSPQLSTGFADTEPICEPSGPRQSAALTTSPTYEIPAQQSQLAPQYSSDQIRGVPNVILRGSLFSISQERSFAEKYEQLATVGGIEIRVKGERFNQTDLDVLEMLLLYARRQPLERPVAFKVNSLLAALGRNGGGQDHEQLQRELLRLQNGSVHIIVGKRSKNFSGAFLKTFYRDRKTQTWNVIFDAQLLSLYEEGYTYVNWKERRSLGKNSLAKWLHGFYASHANPFPYKVTTLKRLCGSATNRVCDFRKTLKGALTALEKIGAIVEWRIDEKTDLVTVTNRKKSRLSSQDLKNHFAQAAASAVNIREVATTSKPLLQEIIPTHTHASTLAASADTVATSLPFDEWTLDALRALEWKRFELLCAKYYETLGFKPKTVEFGPDDGIDIKLFRAEEIKPVCIVQCKAWNHWAVGVAPVRELLGVMTSENVAHGVFLTTSSFTKEAAAFATKNSIHILDGLLLIKKLRALANAPRTQLLEFAFAGDYATPTCPSCGAKMVTNKESANGVAWRCSGYPRCRSFFTLNGKALGRP